MSTNFGAAFVLKSEVALLLVKYNWAKGFGQVYRIFFLKNSVI